MLESTAFLYGSNAAFIEGLYAQYLSNPESVDGTWRAFFDALGERGVGPEQIARGPSWSKQGDGSSDANELLSVEKWPEFAPPGLQVMGAAEVSKLVSGVSASRALFRLAGERGAQMVLVHHGLFWRKEPLVVDARIRGRLEALFDDDMSLLAYHLALDAHPEVGNNALLADGLGAARHEPFAEHGGRAVGVAAAFDGDGVEAGELFDRVRDLTRRDPLVFADGLCAPHNYTTTCMTYDVAYSLTLTVRHFTQTVVAFPTTAPLGSQVTLSGRVIGTTGTVRRHAIEVVSLDPGKSGPTSGVRPSGGGAGEK